MNDEINQIEKLLNVANDTDLGDSVYFYNEIFQNLLTNVVIVDSGLLAGIDKYICDMSDGEFRAYEERLQHLKISGCQVKEFFNR